jgi:cold shock CspA family protein/ribosome-associated translation inhibitor RaiA
MQQPFQITYRHCDPSEALNAFMRDKAAELDQFYPRIVGCHAFVERPGNHHRKGKGAHYRVRLELTVPGKVLVVSRDPEKHIQKEDPYLSVNEAFHEMRRQLQDYARRQRGDVKVSERAPHARVARLHLEEGFGFLETADGREIYFHRASVLDQGFERLGIGDEVRFTEEAGDEGPQASTVEPVGSAGHHELPAPL